MKTSPRWFVFLGIAFAGGLAMTAANNYLFPLMTQLGVKISPIGFALRRAPSSNIPSSSSATA